jgi:hypothetical protein
VPDAISRITVAALDAVAVWFDCSVVPTGHLC